MTLSLIWGTAVWSVYVKFYLSWEQTIQLGTAVRPYPTRTFWITHRYTQMTLMQPAQQPQMVRVGLASQASGKGDTVPLMGVLTESPKVSK